MIDPRRRVLVGAAGALFVVLLAALPSPGAVARLDEATADKTLREAQRLRRTGQLAAAERTSRAVLEAAEAGQLSDLRQAQSLALLVSVYHASGRDRDAIRAGLRHQQSLQAIRGPTKTDLNAASRDAALTLAECYASLEQFDEAEQMLARALKLAQSSIPPAQAAGAEPKAAADQAPALAILTVMTHQARLADARKQSELARKRWNALVDRATPLLARLSPGSTQHTNCGRLLVEAHTALGNVDAASQVATSLLESDRTRADLEGQVWDLVHLAALRRAAHDESGEHDRLEKALEKQRQIKPPAPADEADLLTRLADCARQYGRFTDARRRWHDAAAIYATLLKNKPTNDFEAYRVAIWLQELQTIDQLLGDFAAATPVAQRLLGDRMAKLDPADPRIYQSRQVLGTCLGITGQPMEARPLLEEAAQYWRNRRPLRADELAAALSSLGAVERDLGEFTAAEKVLNEALDLTKRNLNPDDLLRADVQINLASVWAAQGKFSQAIDQNQQVVEFCRKQGPPAAERQSTALLNIGMAYKSQRRYDEAAKYAQQALDIQHKVSAADDPALLPYYVALASVYIASESWDKADQATSEARKICELNHLEQSSLAGPLWYQLALAEYRKQPPNLAQARLAFQRALNILRAGGQRTLQARALNFLAELAVLDEDWQQADQFLNESVSLQDQLHAFPGFFNITLCNYAQVLRRQGRNEEAIKQLQRALDVVEIPRSGVAGAESERAEYFSQFAAAFDLLVDWYVEQGRLDEALIVAERGRNRTFLDQIRAGGVDLRETLRGTPSEPLIGQEKALEEKIARLQAVAGVMGDAPSDRTRRAQLDERLTSLRGDYARLFRQVRDASPFYRDILATTPAADFWAAVYKKFAASDDVTAVYYLGQQHSYLFVVGRRVGGVRVFPLDISNQVGTALGVSSPRLTRPLAAALVKRYLMVLSNPKRADALTRGLRRTVVSEKANFSATQSRALTEVLLPKPARKLLDDSGVRLMTLVPDGALHDLPFEALPLEDGQFVIDVLPSIAYAPSAMVLASLLERAPLPDGSAPRVVSVGDPQYQPARGARVELTGASRGAFVDWSSQLTPLPYTSKECARVVRVFGPERSTLLEGSQATEQAVRSDVRERARSHGNYFLHLAAHGIVDEQHDNIFGAIALTLPSGSNVLPSDDGFLMMHEIYGLPLSGCKLAVLSACQTNVGPEQPLEAGSSLTRAFLAAGTERVVSSHWNVDDESTAELIGTFFERLATATAKRDGAVRYAEALQLARQRVRTDPKHPQWASPYYWAPFVLVGPAQEHGSDREPSAKPAATTAAASSP